MIVLDVLTGAVRGGTSILYAGLGETVSERAGVVNLGIEGCMLCGALGAYAVTAQSGSPWLGALAGAVAGGMLAAVHAYFVINRRSNQLATGLIVFFLLFLISMALHAWGGAREHSADEISHGGHAISVVHYLRTAQFWFESFQNWQSEFMVVALLIGAAVFLRQRGSPESKPVASPHSETGD